MTELNTLLGRSSAENEDQIFAEQVRLLYDSTILGCIIQATVIISLALAQQDFAPHAHIAGILGFFLIITLSRLALNTLYNKKNPPPQDSRKWARYYTIPIGLLGLGWVMAAYIFITTSESVNVIFSAMILGGISSGALISMAAHLRTYYTLLFPTMLSGIVLYIHVGTPISYYTAGLGALLMLFLIVSARRLNTTLVSNIALKFEYKFLFNDLANEKKTTDSLNENLKLEINERKHAEEKSQAALEHAETTNSVKSEFLSSMRHELRTPLNAIMGFGQLLDHSTIDQKQGKYVKEILNSGRLLLALINQVLDLAKIERGQMEIYTVRHCLFCLWGQHLKPSRFLAWVLR